MLDKVYHHREKQNWFGNSLLTLDIPFHNFWRFWHRNHLIKSMATKIHENLGLHPGGGSAYGTYGIPYV